MEQETKKTLRNYGICVGIEVLIGFCVIWSKGFFQESTAVNLQIWADAFFVAGILMSLFAGLIFVSSQGAFIGVGFVMRNVVLTFIPMGRLRHEKFIDYRTRKMGQLKKRQISPSLVTGLTCLVTGIILTAIWYATFYNV